MSDIPFIDLAAQQARIRADLEARIKRVLDHGRYIMGPEIDEAEERLAEFAGVKHAITVSSGTDALVAPLMALGVGPGDAVFCPAFTFTATAEVIALLGATPVFVDVEQATFNIDVNRLRERIGAVREAGALAPRVVMAVDLFGLPADYAGLGALCEEEGLTLLADAAQSFGAAQGGVRVGRLAPVTATSFFPAKPLGCYGDGGAVFTDDDLLAAKLKSIRQHGQGAERYDIERIGLNARFDSIQAAVLLAKLEIFEDEIERRQRIAAAYSERLDGYVDLPSVPEGSLSAWAQYTVRSNGRDKIRKDLQAAGIPTAIYYPRPMHLQTAYAAFGDGAGSCPVAEALCDEVFSLPMHPYLDEAAMDRICAAVAESAREAAAGAAARG